MVHIGLGSNVADRLSHLRLAVRRLRDTSPSLGVGLAACSRVYETTPIPAARGQELFLNAVIAVKAACDLTELLSELQKLESGAGRVRGADRNAARELDLDILLAGPRVVDMEGLSVPHPRLHERRFVLEPLADIAPDAVHPILQRRIIDLRDAARSRYREQVVIATEFTLDCALSPR